MSSRIITLNKPGLYVAEHNSTGKQFLVSIGGELPMLRVINIINLSDFVSGFYADNKDKQKLQDDMEAHPNTYTYTPIQVKLEKEYEEVKEDILDLSKYSTQGFDVVFYFINKMLMEQEPKDGVMNSIYLQNLKDGNGQENKACFILKQEDFEIVKKDLIYD